MRISSQNIRIYGEKLRKKTINKRISQCENILRAYVPKRFPESNPIQNKDQRLTLLIDHQKINKAKNVLQWRDLEKILQYHIVATLHILHV